MTKAMRAATTISLLLTTQWLTRLSCERGIPAVQVPQESASKEGAADDVAKRHRDDGLIDEFAD